MIMTEGSLEVKLPTMWTDEKQRWELSEKRRGEKRRKIKLREKKVRRKKIQVREKAGKSRILCFFPMICGSGVLRVEVGSLNWRVQSHMAR